MGYLKAKSFSWIIRQRMKKSVNNLPYFRRKKIRKRFR